MDRRRNRVGRALLVHRRPGQRAVAAGAASGRREQLQLLFLAVALRLNGCYSFRIRSR